MKTITVYEYDCLIQDSSQPPSAQAKTVPFSLFNWLCDEALRLSESQTPAWLRLTQWRGQPAIRILNYVGVVQSKDGHQLEILPKIGRASYANDELRKLLLRMLSTLREFRFIKTNKTVINTARMPLLEIFISEFLTSVEELVKRGIRSDYLPTEENLFALKGKIMVASHLRENIVRKDRFYASYDEYSVNRPVNRLVRLCLDLVAKWSKSSSNQERARNLIFIFLEVPASNSADSDLQRINLDRGMSHYQDTVRWVRLILSKLAPTVGSGHYFSFSLLVPMETLFESYVAKAIASQLKENYRLITQARSHYLVQHQGSKWFQMKPDLLICEGKQNKLVLDTKWKLLDSSLGNTENKYELKQSDLYQLFAYGKHYLQGCGDVVLIYPMTDDFSEPLPVFEFSDSTGLRLWVLPFDLGINGESRLLLPQSEADKFEVFENYNR